MDRCFEETNRHFAKQQEIKVGLTIVELVKTKFLFSESTLCLLEHTKVPKPTTSYDAEHET